MGYNETPVRGTRATGTCSHFAPLRKEYFTRGTTQVNKQKQRSFWRIAVIVEKSQYFSQLFSTKK
jgi:hypothetical protein